ncbi:MAG TPA: hypothetical protein VKF36_05255 [Syntrophorhabdales bacterium]|nr:hypothetical protein [Syntrophorhabdales bacterium]
MAFKSLVLACFILTAAFCFHYSMNDGEYAHALGYYNREINSQSSQLLSMLDEQGKAALRKDQQEWQRQTNLNGFGHGRAFVIEALKQRAAYLEAWVDLIKEQRVMAARNMEVETLTPPSVPPETQTRPSEQQYQGQAPQTAEPIREAPASYLNTTATTGSVTAQQSDNAPLGSFYLDSAHQSEAPSLR